MLRDDAPALVAVVLVVDVENENGRAANGKRPGRCDEVDAGGE